jgi:hypothetical protein
MTFRINDDMHHKWADLACANEVGFLMISRVAADAVQHGSIAVQQVFEVFGSQDLMVSTAVEHEAWRLTFRITGTLLSRSLAPLSRRDWS